MYYPYDEDRAGILRDRHLTSKASEYLLADREIVSLAKKTLTTQEYREAENLAIELTGTKRKRELARDRLIEIVRPPPKRPLYYAQDEVLYLPHHTRDTLRYLGDFIDMLVKSAVYEKTRDTHVFRLSLGPAIGKFETCWPDSKGLAGLLRKYNRFLYRGAKHDFELPAGRRMHRFTSREVVLTIFITMKLADKIIAISPVAERARQDQKIM